jgi:hypothetical protein
MSPNVKNANVPNGVLRILNEIGGSEGFKKLSRMVLARYLYAVSMERE